MMCQNGKCCSFNATRVTLLRSELSMPRMCSQHKRVTGSWENWPYLKSKKKTHESKNTRIMYISILPALFSFRKNSNWRIIQKSGQLASFFSSACVPPSQFSLRTFAATSAFAPCRFRRFFPPHDFGRTSQSHRSLFVNARTQNQQRVSLSRYAAFWYVGVSFCVTQHFTWRYKSSSNWESGKLAKQCNDYPECFVMGERYRENVA